MTLAYIDHTAQVSHSSTIPNEGLTASATVNLPATSYGHAFYIYGQALNPGGVRILKISVNGTPVAEWKNTPDASGQVPTLQVFAGDVGGAPISFVNTATNVVAALATNFNGQATTVAATFVPQVPPPPPPPPPIVTATVNHIQCTDCTSDHWYENFGASAVITWSVTGCNGSCSVTFATFNDCQGRDYNSQAVSTVVIGLSGTKMVVPQCTLNRYVVQATGSNGTSSGTIYANTYAPHD